MTQYMNFNEIIENLLKESQHQIRAGQEKFRQLYSENYPISNIKRHKETGDIVLEIALAGINPDDVSVKQKSFDGKSALVIEHKKEHQSNDDEEKFEYAKKNIAQRAFKSYFKIPDRYEVAEDGVDLLHGLLTITMKKKEMEEQDEIVFPLRKTVKTDHR